jgi:hypothetical protein
MKICVIAVFKIGLALLTLQQQIYTCFAYITANTSATSNTKKFEKMGLALNLHCHQISTCILPNYLTILHFNDMMWRNNYFLLGEVVCPLN